MKKTKNLFLGGFCLIAFTAFSYNVSYAGDSVTTDPPPIFQNGNTLPKPNAENSPQVSNFINFYDKHVTVPLPASLTANDIIPFPSDKTDTVFPKPDHTVFTTANQCSECHDGTVVSSKTQPNMTFLDKKGDLLANWSMYGDWRGSLMGLSGRDPVFTAQVEGERIQNPGIATVIDNTCYTCHASMGVRQLANDQKKEGVTDPQLYSNCMIFSTKANNQNIPADCKELASSKYAQYGAQGRDGISCMMCHTIGPKDNQWTNSDGTFKWNIYYGPEDPEISQRLNPAGPPYPFTSNFEYNMQRLYVPDVGIEKSQYPMQQKSIPDVEYNTHLKESSFCGSCHVVIVPQVPKGYVPGGLIPGGEGTKFTDDIFTDPNVGLAYEQTTYLEWIDSNYAVSAKNDELQCQGCHMTGVHVKGSEHPAKVDIVNLNKGWKDVDVQPRVLKRHDYVGSNLFVAEMFAQFYKLLGVTPEDPLVPENSANALVNMEENYLETGTGGADNTAPPAVKVSIKSSKKSSKNLITKVLVENTTGHKFPSGIGFRRGFLQFEVLDKDGNVLWASGRTNPQGAIVDEKGDVLVSEFTKNYKKLQPHREVIKKQNQAQIYEVRTLNQAGQLTTQVLGLFTDVKDNRLLAKGWKPASSFEPKEMYRGLNMQTIANITSAHKGEKHDEPYVPRTRIEDDPYYKDPTLTGGDMVTYKIPNKDIEGAVSVRASMIYQTTPPYYLVDRFNTGMATEEKRASATERLIYLTSRLNTNLNLKNVTADEPKFNVLQDWGMRIDVATETIK